MESREMTYRFYISEGIRVLTENSAHLYGGTTLTKSFLEVIKPQKEETRTADEIIDHFKRGLSE